MSSQQGTWHKGDPRLAAALALTRILPQLSTSTPSQERPEPGQSLREVLPEYREGFTPQQQGLLSDLCFGVCRYLHILEPEIDNLLHKKIKRKDRVIRALLLCGAYEILLTDKKIYAITNSYPDSCKKSGRPWAAGLCNAILRNLSKKRPSSDEPSKLLDALSPSNHYGLPAWIYNQLQQDWPNYAQEIAYSSLFQAPFCVRQKPGHSQLLDQWQQQGLTCRKAPVAEYGWYLEPAVNVQQLPGFAEGLVSVQDEAAQLPAQLIARHLQKDPRFSNKDWQPNILDACAAPGGKTGQLLELLPQARLLALDKDATRLKRVEDNLARIHCQARTLCADASTPQTWFDGTAFDAILLDAPCSASGILRRQPDIKWHRQPEDIAALVAIQQQLLEQLWPLLEPGGILLYATCSVFRDENDRQISRFLAQHADSEDITPAADWGVCVGAGRQLFPGAPPEKDTHDGFYVACLHKHP